MKIILSIILSFLFLTSHSLYAQTKDALDARNLGYKFQQEGNIEKAIMQYETAAQLDPSYATPYNDLGILYEQMGDIQSAILAYNKALSVNPNYASVYTNLASLHEAQGDLQSAAGYWQKRAELGERNDPWREKAKDRLREINRQLRRPSVPSNEPRTVMRNPVNSAEMMAKNLIKKAKKDIKNGHYDTAFEKLEEARSLGGDQKKINQLIHDARESQIEFEIQRTALNNHIYKYSKLVDVEEAWFPPQPETDAGKVNESDLSLLENKSPARLILEKKAQEIIPSIDFTNGRLSDVIEFLAISNDINIVIDESVVQETSGVTIKLKNIPLVEALDIILRTKGLKYRFEENIIWITTEEKLAQEDLVVKVYDVQDLIGKLHDFPGKPFDIESTLNDSGSQGETSE